MRIAEISRFSNHLQTAQNPRRRGLPNAFHVAGVSVSLFEDVHFDLFETCSNISQEMPKGEDIPHGSKNNELVPCSCDFVARIS